MKKYFLIPLFIVLSLSFFAKAAPINKKNKNSIDSIFNIKFDSSIHKYKILSKEKIDYETSYFIIGDKEIPNEYKNYIDEIAILESKDEKVHEVWGIGSEINRKECNKERDELFQKLEKYGTPYPAKDFNPDDDKKILAHNGNEIYITCQGLMFSHLYLKIKEHKG